MGQYTRAHTWGAHRKPKRAVPTSGWYGWGHPTASPRARDVSATLFVLSCCAMQRTTTPIVVQIGAWRWWWRPPCHGSSRIIYESLCESCYQRVCP